VFINGEYWGLHSLKERVDSYFIQNQFNIDDNDVTLLNQSYRIYDGASADSIEMESLEDYIVTQDMTSQSSLNYVSDRMDIDNYIDYMCSEIFLGNGDWVFNNVIMWRKTGGYFPSEGKGENGKFRWILYDLDGAFGGNCSTASYTHKTLDSATVSTGPYSSYTRVFRGLLENSEFENKFINRMMDLNNSWFKTEVVQSHINEMYNILTPEMEENVRRWRYPSIADSLESRYLEIPSLRQWDTVMTYFMPRFAERRPRKVREHFMIKWGIGDTSLIEVDVNNAMMGSVKVNSILINDKLPGVNMNVYPWFGTYMNTVQLPLIAVPYPGYRFLEWQGTGITTDTLLWTPNGDSSFMAVFEIDTAYSPILINEVMLSNQTAFSDNFEDYDDWIELFNPNTDNVNISNCKIRKGNLIWDIPSGTTIDGNGYTLFWHDNQSFQGSNHAEFKLANQSDTIYFLLPDGSVIDSLEYPFTSTDFSYGRFPNGSDSFTIFSEATPLNNNNFTEIVEPYVEELKVFPVPASSGVHLNRTVDFSLYDLSGRLLLSGIDSDYFKVGQLSDGAYLLKTRKYKTQIIIVRKN